MSITIDPPELSIVSDDHDIGRARKTKQLEARIAQLEANLAAVSGVTVPTATIAKPAPNPSCRYHLKVVVSEHANRVECGICGEPLSPIAVLRQFAHEERRFAHTIEALRQERIDLRKEIEALKKQKQGLRNAVRKAGGVPVNRYSHLPPKEQ